MDAYYVNRCLCTCISISPFFAKEPGPDIFCLILLRLFLFVCSKEDEKVDNTKLKVFAKYFVVLQRAISHDGLLLKDHILTSRTQESSCLERDYWKHPGERSLKVTVLNRSCNFVFFGKGSCDKD